MHTRQNHFEPQNFVAEVFRGCFESLATPSNQKGPLKSSNTPCVNCVQGLLCGSGLRVALRARNVVFGCMVNLRTSALISRLRFKFRNSQPQSGLRFFAFVVVRDFSG